MSIHFVSGKPGGGKSLYALKLCFEELLYGSRVIVTNLAVRVGQLNEYYQANYDNPKNLRRLRLPKWLWWLYWIFPEWMILRLDCIAVEEIETRIKTPRLDDICSRIHLITDEEMAVFFTKRPGCEVEHVGRDDWKQGKRPDYSVVNDKGVFFCLDEVHIPFNARAWAETGAEVIFYLSQHRKLGDDVICITQSVANVDKQFRSVAQDFTYLRNLGKEVSGWFRLPLRFVRKTYSQAPTTDDAKPMDWGIFSLDAHGLANCYDTAKGIGIHGRAGADTKERKRGLHWGWFAVGVPVGLFCLVHFTPNLLTKFLSVGHRAAVKAGVPVPPVSAQNAVLPNVSQKFSPLPAANETQAVTVATNQPELFCTGYLIFYGQSPQAYLSDGTTVEPPDLQLIAKHFIIVNGRKIPIRLTRPDYVPEPALQYDLPRSAPDRPVNDIQVTVIGKDHRQAPPPLGGLKQMQQQFTQ